MVGEFFSLGFFDVGDFGVDGGVIFGEGIVNECEEVEWDSLLFFFGGVVCGELWGARDVVIELLDGGFVGEVIM